MDDPSPNKTLPPRLPRFPIEEPLGERSLERDTRAIEIAHTALTALEKLRGNRRKRKLSPTESKLPTNDDKDSQSASFPVALDSKHDAPVHRLQNGSAYGKEIWPKTALELGIRHALQYSWSNIGFPTDNSLAVQRLQDYSHIEHDERSVVALGKDIFDIKNKQAKDIADDGQVTIEVGQGRRIENFTVHGMTVTRVTFDDVDATEKTVNYSKLQASKDFEKSVTGTFGKAAQPSLESEQLVVAHVLLCRGGQIGGRSDKYWQTARDLAQQHMFLRPDIVNELRNKLEAGSEDGAFLTMLSTVKKALGQHCFNPYHQAQRDDHAVSRGHFYKIDTEIVLILDAKTNIIAFQCSDVFRKLLTKSMERNIAEALDVFSSLQPTPYPDVTRHGLHFVDWLKKRPDLDFRRRENDPRQAKSGVYHWGARFPIGDPNGESKGMKYQGPRGTKDLREHMLAECDSDYARLRYGALAACTDVVGFFFRLLDQDLFAKYVAVADQVSKHAKSQQHLLPFETRDQEEIFAMRAVLVNLMTNEHKDKGDWQCGLAGMVTTGDFKGGDLLLRELGLQIAGGPGCVQLIRGRELRHSITEFTGRRFVVVHVTHDAVRRWAFREMELPVTTSGYTTMNTCIDGEHEDMVPEDQYQPSAEELFPERFEQSSNEASPSSDGSEDQEAKES